MAIFNSPGIRSRISTPMLLDMALGSAAPTSFQHRCGVTAALLLVVCVALTKSGLADQAARSYPLCCRPATDINYIIYDSFIDKRAPAAAKGIVVRSYGRFGKQTHRTSRQIKISDRVPR
ncbi:hypothetical protein QTP88_022342 [Uroleucon formosanum]